MGSMRSTSLRVRDEMAFRLKTLFSNGVVASWTGALPPPLTWPPLTWSLLRSFISGAGGA